jgi:hypothetical protein
MGYSFLWVHRHRRTGAQPLPDQQPAAAYAHRQFQGSSLNLRWTVEAIARSGVEISNSDIASFAEELQPV